jgi:hypothetical protein
MIKVGVYSQLQAVCRVGLSMEQGKPQGSLPSIISDWMIEAFEDYKQVGRNDYSAKKLRAE